MNDAKSSISQASTDEEMGEFWDTHSLADYWDQTEPAEFNVNIERPNHYAVDRTLNEQVQALARQRGVSAETLLNLLIAERLYELRHAGADSGREPPPPPSDPQPTQTAHEAVAA